MAFCVKCGSKLEEGALFCTNCGNKVAAEATEVKEEVKEEVKVESNATEAKAEASTASTSTNNTTNTTSTASTTTSTSTNANVEAAKEKLKAVPKKVWAIAVLVIVALIVLNAFINYRKHILDLNKYLDVQFVGYEELGKCEADWSGDFWEDFYDKASKIPSSSNYDIMMKKLKYEVSPTEGLSNGDKVEVKWNVDKKYFKKHYGLNIKCDDNKIKVDGLETVDTFDPFDGIKVVYTGLEGSGNASVEITSDDPIYSELEFSFENGYHLSTGDKITCELQMRGYYNEDEIIERCAEKYGEIPSSFEKEYTVEGLGHYVEKCSELTKKNLKPLQRTADDVLVEKTADWNRDGVITMSSTKYLGAYVLMAKDKSSNKVYLVYEVTVDFDEHEQHDSCTYYTYVEFVDVTINDDGELSCDFGRYHDTPDSFSYESTIEDTYWNETYYLNGFEKISLLNDDIVTGNLSRYDSDTNVSMKESKTEDENEDSDEE